MPESFLEKNTPLPPTELENDSNKVLKKEIEAKEGARGRYEGIGRFFQNIGNLWPNSEKKEEEGEKESSS